MSHTSARPSGQGVAGHRVEQLLIRKPHRGHWSYIMGHTVHRFRVHDARKIPHPVFSEIGKYWLTVCARDFPRGISTKANTRDPVGLNRPIYKDVRESLKGKTSVPGTFDLLNKGITILAVDVRMSEKSKGFVELVVDDEAGGIVDGGHTAKLIWDAQEADQIPAEQFVDVYVRTNISGGLITDIARGLNTSIQVQAKSIYNHGGVFDWLKEAIASEPYADQFSWRESDSAEYDVRDLVGVLECFNVFDFPNDSGKHPVTAYEKWSVVLDRFEQDFQTHKDDLTQSKYFRLKPLLLGALALYDYIRREFRDIHNDNGGSAGALNIVEDTKRGAFQFPFAGLTESKYRLTKGAAFPILASFRNFVEIDPKTQVVGWRGGFESVLSAWHDAAPELVSQTVASTKEYGRNPDQLGKNRKHWDDLHTKLQNRIMRAMLREQKVMFD